MNLVNTVTTVPQYPVTFRLRPLRLAAHNVVKIGLFALLVISGLSASAQTYRPFKVNLSVGYAVPTASYNSRSLIYSLEPRYAINDRFEVGARIDLLNTERAITSESSVLKETRGTTMYLSTDGVVDSYMLTANYYFSAATIRPFIGVGIGGSGVQFTSFDTDNSGVYSLRSVPIDLAAGMIRAGVKTGHFTVAVEYNQVAKSPYQNEVLNRQNNNAYVGFKAGFDIGGGRR